MPKKIHAAYHHSLRKRVLRSKSPTITHDNPEMVAATMGVSVTA